jgi:hypothetical protein
MMKYLDIPLVSYGYFDEGTRVDVRVHTHYGIIPIFNVTTDITMGEDWLTMEVGHDQPRKGIYIPADKVTYIEIVPSPTYRPKCEVEKNWENNYTDPVSDEFDVTPI